MTAKNIADNEMKFAVINKGENAYIETHGIPAARHASAPILN